MDHGALTREGKSSRVKRQAELLQASRDRVTTVPPYLMPHTRSI